MKIRVMDKVRLPGPRFETQGVGSGEEFREKHLRPAFKKAIENDEKLHVDMDGAPWGYPTSFLEEAFGGLARIEGTSKARNCIRIKSESEPLLEREIMHYIEHGEKIELLLLNCIQNHKA